MRNHSDNTLRNRLSREKGVGLVEVLVALLVLSIGFIGVAGLQMKALSTNNHAMASSIATISIYSIVDAMRLDKKNAEGGSYNQTVIANACPAAGGSLASVQINQWCQDLGNNLGKAATTKGIVSCDANGVCTVTVEFDGKYVGLDGDTIQTVKTRVVL